MDATQFETYGDYDWSGDYRKLVQSGTSAAKEQTIASEGDYPNGVVMIRAGFARLTQRYGDGHRTLNYLGSGGLYGFTEIAQNWSNPGRPEIPLQYTLRVIGYTHVLVIPAPVIEQVVLPSLPKEFLPAPTDPLAEDDPPASGTNSPFSRNPFAPPAGSRPPFGASPFSGAPFSRLTLQSAAPSLGKERGRGESRGARRGGGRVRADGVPHRKPLLQRHGDDDDRHEPLHAVRRLRAGVCVDPRQQPALSPPWPDPRPHHGRPGLACTASIPSA